jgi:hypothetical protein
VKSEKYACPCCRSLTLDEPPPGTFDICPVCWWEDDNVQFDDPEFRGGANEVSLREARANFARIGASDSRWKNRVRLPNSEEIPQQRHQRPALPIRPLPHPSGASRWLNDPENRLRLRPALGVVRRVVRGLDNAASAARMHRST